MLDMEALTTTVTSKFSFVDSIKLAINSLKDIINGVGNAPSISISLGETQYTDATTVSFDMSWYSQFKPFGDIVITGFCYAAFIWRMFIKLPSTLSGAGGTVELIEKKGGDL